MSTNFRQSVNDYFGLDANATAAGRINALRNATLEQIRDLCRTQPNAQAAYTVILDLIAPLPLDPITYNEWGDCIPMWGDTPLCQIPPSMELSRIEAREKSEKKARVTLNVFFKQLYPEKLSDLQPYSFSIERGLVGGYYHDQRVTQGVDVFSATGGLCDHTRWLEKHTEIVYSTDTKFYTVLIDGVALQPEHPTIGAANQALDSYLAWLTAEGLTGLISPLEDATLFEIGEAVHG